LIALFDITRVGRSPSRLDLAKLENLNGHYMRAMSDEELMAALEKNLLNLRDDAVLGTRVARARERMLAAMPGLKERAKNLVELLDSARYLIDERPLQPDDKASAILTPEARGLLKRALVTLERTEWTQSSLDAAVRKLAEREGVKLAAVAQPLRAALTGRSTSPGIFDVLVVLGKEESLARLRDQANLAAAA
ncbi:MAG TPA: glutamate--tRNA ligase, partial [Xanthobacteraceae bacterium]|nr:glutamate--tRNA ligase [Xanthobacteraceae bacterium]